MRKLARFLCLYVALSACSGCESLSELAVKESIAAASGESKKEREDRVRLDQLREQYRNPGAPGGPPGFDGVPDEKKAREAFRKIYGREPNLNWHAR
jgi:hypothetical protein